jgi:hypothetical protein
MSRKISLLAAALCMLVLAAVSSAPASAILCPYISPRCCATDIGPSGCPYCICYSPSECC